MSLFKTQNLIKNSVKGFTLIELLVVVTIIAIISVVAVALFSNAQSSARDSKRKAELESIANALELNKNGSTGFYTTVAKKQFGGGRWPGQTAIDGTTALDPQTYPYCILTTSTGISPPGPVSVTGWATTTPAVSCATSGGGAIIDDSLALFENINAWTICTRLEEEDSGTVFCRSNVQ